MSKLKATTVYDTYWKANSTGEGTGILVYPKSDVDAAIAELKDKCQMHDFFWEGCGFAKRGFKNTIAVSEAFDRLEAENAELKQKLEDAKASHYAEMVDAGMRERRLRRTLWIARAERALEKIAWFKLWNASISTMNPEDGTRQEFDKWKKNLGKFLKKAEEYK
jgi:hypothetical protein